MYMRTTRFFAGRRRRQSPRTGTEVFHLWPDDVRQHFFESLTHCINTPCNRVSGETNKKGEPELTCANPARLLETSLAKGIGAGDGGRTRYFQLGKLTLYQLSYTRLETSLFIHI